MGKGERAAGLAAGASRARACVRSQLCIQRRYGKIPTQKPFVCYLKGLLTKLSGLLGVYSLDGRVNYQVNTGTLTVGSFTVKDMDEDVDSEPAAPPPPQRPPKIRVYFDGQQYLVWKPRDAYVLRCAHRLVGCLVGALPANKRQNTEHGLPLALLFEEVLLGVEEGVIVVVDSRELRAINPGDQTGDADSASGTDLAPVPVPVPATAPAQVPVVALGSPATGEAASTAAPGGAAPPAPPGALGCRTVDGECKLWSELSLPTLTADMLRAADSGRLNHARVYRALWQKGFYATAGLNFGADYLCYEGDPFLHHAHMLVHVTLPERMPRAVELSYLARLAGSVKKRACLALCLPNGGVHLELISIQDAGTPHINSQAVMAAATRAVAAAVGAMAPETTPPPLPAADGPEERKLRLVMQSHAYVESDAWLGGTEPPRKKPRGGDPTDHCDGVRTAAPTANTEPVDEAVTAVDAAFTATASTEQ